MINDIIWVKIKKCLVLLLKGRRIKLKEDKHMPWGRTLTTNDKFLGKRKTNSKKTRGVVVVDTCGFNLAVVPLSSKDGENRTELKKL